MRDVHKQLCIIKRQKAMAAESTKAVVAPKPASLTAKAAASASTLPSPTPSSTASPPTSTPTPTTIAASTVEGGSSGSGNTTISLSGPGTNYSKVDGPIDAGFKSTRQQAGTFQDIKVWGPLDSSRTAWNMGK